jgi:DNA-binding YbaB/EbfC family protein
MVTITTSAKGDPKKVKIDPTLIDPSDAEVLEDLIVAALRDARQKGEAMVQEEMGKLTGGLSLPPGFKLPF